ncbi:MAG TPA: hypothetical protein VGP07_00580 [Polyangia bacterium]|jgi:cytochrome c556
MTRLILRTSLVAALAIGACASAPPQPVQQDQLAKAIAAPDRKQPPQVLSNATRELLRSRMASHTNDMADLVSAIMILEYPRIAERAAAIAADVNLARPLTNDATELNSSIPGSFFDYQDELKERARRLEATAREGSAFHVADAYGRLSETCVKCHAIYRASH